MKKIVVFIMLVINCIFLSGCEFVKKIQPGDFDDYSKRLLSTLVGKDEMTIHFLFKDPSFLELEETTLSLPTPGTTSALGKLMINLYFGPMANYNFDELTEDQKMTYIVILDLLEGINAKTVDMSYLDSNYLGSYLGYQAQLPILFQQYRFDDVEDVYNYFGLLELVPETFEEYYNFEVQKADKGYGMPDFVINKVIEQCVNFTNNTDSHFLITTFDDRIAHLDLSDAEKTELISRNETLVKNDLCEGYIYIKDNLGNLLGRATNNLGLAHYTKTLDDGSISYVGKDFYAYLFKDATGYDDNIEDAIKYIDDHLKEIVQNMKAIMLRNPFIYEDISNIVLMDKTPIEQMEYYKTLIDGHFPSIDVYPTINILNVDESMEDNFSPAAYISSPIDDLTHETIFLNQAKIAGDLNYLYTTLGHEGIPGHMYQNIYFKTQDVNMIRKVLKNSGYQEGWATYCELYMYNFVEGVSQDLIDFMKYNDILNGVLTARLDMGIHYEGWDVLETLEFLQQFNDSYTIENARRIFEQLVEVPTNSQMYYYTYFKICDMYEKAKNTLGDRFNPVDFHKVILDCGPIPLRYVEEVVNLYIDEAKA